MTPWCSGADPTLTSCGTASVATPNPPNPLRDLLDPRLRGGGGALAGGVGARAAERARKALQELERQGRPST